MKKYQSVVHDLMVVEHAAWWNPRTRCILKAAPLVVMFLLLNARSARAACAFNPTPDPTVDNFDSGNSLRHAIRLANESGQNCTIQLQAGTYTLTIPNPAAIGPGGGQDNTGAYGDLDITNRGHTVTIQGKGAGVGAGVSIVYGNHLDRVFQVLGGANAVFSNLTIEGGLAQDDGTAGSLPGQTTAEGGGLLVEDGGHVTLSHVLLRGNQAFGGSGAGGTVHMASGTAGIAASGGGLFLSAGAIILTDSEVSENAVIGGAGGGGGGVFCRRIGPNSSTFTCSGQAGPGGAGGAGAGAGIYVLSGSAGLLRTTVSDNNIIGGNGGSGGGREGPTTDDFESQSGGKGAPAHGAGLFVASGNLRLVQTTVSGNLALGGRGGPGGYTIRSRASSGDALGAGIFSATGNISLTNSTLFANVATGGVGFSTRFQGFGPGGMLRVVVSISSAVMSR